MKNSLIFLHLLILLLLISSCNRERNNKSRTTLHLTNKEVAGQIPNINTLQEIKVYNDFIDQVYNVHYCHLEMDSPKEFLLYNEKATKKEYNSYKKKFDVYLKRFNEMLDTLQITALVPDSLGELNINYTYLRSNLDSTQKATFNKLLIDTLVCNPAAYNVDSLQSGKTHFEKIPKKYLRTDYEKMPHDTFEIFYHQRESFFQSHFGQKSGNKYYIGIIELSRVKFNVDSTLCILECGYTAQNKCGYGYYYLLKKNNKKWEVLAKIRSWVS